MPVYNGEKYLAEAIDSILAQTFTDFELIIVDDGSEDGSLDLMRTYEARDDRIRSIALERNMGIADARNHGIAAASGEFIATMDCDDISLPQRFEKQVNFLEAHPEIGAVGTAGQAVNEDMTKVLFDLKVPEEHCRIILAKFVGVSFIYTTIMVRGAVMKAVGGYLPGRRTGEERELYWRILWETRTRFANLPDNLYLYRRHSQSIGHDRNAMLEAEVTETRTLMLRQLLSDAAHATMNRFSRMASGEKLGWLERRSAKRDMLRLIESAIERGLVEPQERRLMVNDMSRRLEGTMPRQWQKFLHWRRHRLGRLGSLGKAEL